MNVGSMMTTCNDDGVATYNIYLGDSCSGSPFMSDVIDFNDDDDEDTDADTDAEEDNTTFRTECDVDIDCTFARFTILPYDEESGECAEAAGAVEQTVFVGECLSNGTASFYMACDDTSVTRSVYMSADCTGDAVEVHDLMYDFGGDERCDPGEVVDCYMTEPDYADDATDDGTDDGTDDATDDTTDDSDEPDANDPSTAFKTNVGQVALILVALMAGLMMA